MTGAQFATFVALIPLIKKGIMSKTEVISFYEEVNEIYTKNDRDGIKTIKELLNSIDE